MFEFFTSYIELFCTPYARREIIANHTRRQLIHVWLWFEPEERLVYKGWNQSIFCDSITSAPIQRDKMQYLTYKVFISCCTKDAVVLLFSDLDGPPYQWNGLIQVFVLAETTAKFTQSKGTNDGWVVAKFLLDLVSLFEFGHSRWTRKVTCTMWKDIVGLCCQTLSLSLLFSIYNAGICKFTVYC